MEHPIHHYSANHKLFLISVREFLTLPVKNWRYNRSPDKIRCKDIATYILKTKAPLETVFYLVKNKAYEVLDGIHRYTALKMIVEEPADYITNDIEWLLSSQVLLNIRYKGSNCSLYILLFLMYYYNFL
jgi:hypothetical protein